MGISEEIVREQPKPYRWQDWLDTLRVILQPEVPRAPTLLTDKDATIYFKSSSRVSPFMIYANVYGCRVLDIWMRYFAHILCLVFVFYAYHARVELAFLSLPLFYVAGNWTSFLLQLLYNYLRRQASLLMAKRINDTFGKLHSSIRKCIRIIREAEIISRSITESSELARPLTRQVLAECLYDMSGEDVGETNSRLDLDELKRCSLDLDARVHSRLGELIVQANSVTTISSSELVKSCVDSDAFCKQCVKWTSILNNNLNQALFKPLTIPTATCPHQNSTRIDKHLTLIMHQYRTIAVKLELLHGQIDKSDKCKQLLTALRGDSQLLSDLMHDLQRLMDPISPATHETLDQDLVDEHWEAAPSSETDQPQTENQADQEEWFEADVAPEPPRPKATLTRKERINLKKLERQQQEQQRLVRDSEHRMATMFRHELETVISSRKR